MLILSCRVWLHLELITLCERLPVTRSPSPSRLPSLPKWEKIVISAGNPTKGSGTLQVYKHELRQELVSSPTWPHWFIRRSVQGRKRDHIWHIFQKMSAPLRGNPVTMNRWNDVFFSWKWKIRECRHVRQALTELLSLNGCFHNSLFQGLRVVQCTLVLKVWINPPAKTWWWERRWCWPKWCCCCVLHNYNRFRIIFLFFLPHFMMAGLPHLKCSASVGSSEIKLIRIDPAVAIFPVGGVWYLL